MILSREAATERIVKRWLDQTVSKGQLHLAHKSEVAQVAVKIVFDLSDEELEALPDDDNCWKYIADAVLLWRQENQLER